PGSKERVGLECVRWIVNNARKMSWRLLPLLAALSAGCDLPGHPDPADRPLPADPIKGFGPPYATRCAGCQGGAGKPGPAPPPHAPLFLAIVADAELARVITEGRTVTSTQKSLMPAFGLGKSLPLTDPQIKAWAEFKEETNSNPKQHGLLTVAQIK